MLFRSSNDVDVHAEMQGVQVCLRDQEAEQLAMKKQVAELIDVVSELRKVPASYKDAVVSGDGGSATIGSSSAPTANPRCIVRAPRGLFQGRSAAARAQAFNAKVILKLQKIDGHMSMPEATGLVQIKGKAGDDFDLWIAFFNSVSEVSKLFTYKPQLKHVCPDVFVQPDMSREERMQRKLLKLGARQFIEHQAVPANWRFRWVDKLKILITGPAMARRNVIMADGVAKVVMEGNVRFVDAKDKGGYGRVEGQTSA